jgi:CheY-like chemotaxis protein
LLVDDEPLIRRVTTQLLKKLGHQVTTVADGAAALQRLEASRENYDLVMLDLKMPGLSGWETLDRIDTIQPILPVLGHSGVDLNEAMRRRICQRANTEFVAKPYTSANLNSAIGRVFTRKTY